MSQNKNYQEALKRIEKVQAEKSTNLNLFGLELSSLPPEISNLTSLTRLDLNSNQFHVLPPEICKLTSLTRLSISNNHLSTLPSEISNLIKLNTLLLHGNKLSVLHSEIGKLFNLKYLRLDFNRLDALPPEIGKLTSLTKIYLSNNQLSALPSEIRQLANLKELYLDGNPNLSIPPEILETNDPAAIFAAYFGSTNLFNTVTISSPYFMGGTNIVGGTETMDDDAIRQLIDSVLKTFRRPLLEAKVILVGQGSVGKTSLIKRIIENNFDKRENKTEGIQISKWKVDASTTLVSDSGEKDKISLNIWDFGGQEIMHATHQFFLTKRSLYVLVLDSRISQEENRLEYWLKIIQSFGETAPIILVGNKIDQHPLDIDKTGLQKKYPQIKAILETSCADGRGIESLRTKIATEIAQLPHIYDELPQKWFNIKDKLAERDDNYLPYSDYLEICNQHDVIDETSQRTLIGFLHDLGTMLYFQDDLRLSELGVLNPQWVTNGVYNILNSHTLFHNKGVLQLKDLSEILPANEYPRNRHPFIIDMMEKFEICFRFEGKAGRYLIPDLLPKSEPDTGDWAGSLQFQFHYPVLPSSIISRFIVRMNPFISKNTVWRAGVVLNLEGSRALVKADTEDRRIYISVQNGNPRLALSAIRNQLKSIHETISGLEASEKVPIPGHPEIPPLDYEHLVTLENLGEETYIPEGLGERINVRDLLNGLQVNAPQNSDIFISYSHNDKAFVKKLAGNLAKDERKVWWDFDALKGGQDWQNEIEKGISKCKNFLVVLTPDAMKSEWVANEIAFAQQKGKRIIPLRLKECDVPIGLIRKQYVDFTNKTHKIATDELLDIL